MFENYLCKIYVSTQVEFTNKLEATAFGFDDGESKKILTAAHVVTNALGKTYTTSNSVKLYVKFENHHGEVNSTPVLVDFILKNCNDENNFDGLTPFVDSAEIVLNENVSQPISNFFKRTSPSVDDDVIGLGYPLGENEVSRLTGKIKNISSQDCTKHYNQKCITSRLMIAHDSSPGCSGGPYITNVDDEHFVIGSLIGLMDGCDPSVNPHIAIQSAVDF